MKNAFNRLRSGMETLNLTMLLILNLFFMVFLLLAVCTVLVLAGVDEGFLYHLPTHILLLNLRTIPSTAKYIPERFSLTYSLLHPIPIMT